MKTFGKQLVGILLAMMAGAAQGAWADSTVTTEADLRTAVQSNQAVTLGDDITLNSGRLDISGTVTLDLNGHTLTRPMTAADDGGQVIAVAASGKLTIKDSGTGGKITGGWAYQGGGIYVYSGGELTLTGGTITGNRADLKEGEGIKYGYGGGVEVQSGGTLTMTGGTITGNTAAYGGGIYMDGANNTSYVMLTMTGGSITGNTASIAGGGIYQWNCTVNMQGSPVVKDNSSDDYFLGNYGLITVTGAFTSGANIGVSTERVQDNFTSGYKTYNSEDPSTYFHVGSSRISGSIGWNSNNTEAKLTMTGYKYIDHTWNHSTKTLTTEEKTKANGEYTVLGSNSGWTELSGGQWYVVNGEINIGTLVVHGTGNLILCDNARLTVTGGVKVELKDNAVLNIYGQTGNTGQLIVTNSYSKAAGIGSGGGSDDGNAGIINIHGGTIHATGNKYGAGIGGGDGQSFGPQANNSGLYVYGGSVTAQGGEYAAGIGSGDEPSDGTAGYVAVYGGTVNATGGNEAAGIGGGNEGNGAMFSIYGGTVTAQGGAEGAGIGGGDEGNSSTTTFYGGTVTATGGRRGAGIGGGRSGYATAISFHGGNITAIGGEQYSDVTAGGAAGIGGGYKGECRGIYFYGAAESVNGLPATVNATGKHGGAGIGSGYNTDFCQLDISGGNITATADGKGPGIGRGYTTTGMSRQSSDKKVLVNISGGDVTASSTNGGAGIGTGADTNFNGNINISGGKVTATGINGGAGIGTGGSIGGEKSFMYGWIVISGGEVIAKGEYNDDNSKVYWSGCGAGIGSGAAGEIYPEGLIQLLGGNVTASSMSGGAIGAGGTKVNENSQRDTWVDCPIQIHGDNTTLTLTSGQVRDMIISDNTATWAPSPAIRVHPDRGGYVSINGNLAVTKGSAISAEANRVSTLTTATEQQVTVSPCTHDSNTYTINDDTHTAHCNYCPFTEKQAHATTGTCVCGYETGIYTVTLHTCDDVATGYVDIQQQVATGHTYEVPYCDDVPLGWEFVGWAKDATPGTSLEQQTGETLIQPGETLTAATTLVARYQKIELSLTDTGTNNMPLLNKYHGIRASSVTLSGRTLYKDGKWNTLCLPFDVTTASGTLSGDNVQAMTLNTETSKLADGTLTLNFDDATGQAIPAGTPFIIKWDKSGTDITAPVFEGVTVSNAKHDATVEGVLTFAGTYAPVSIADGGDNTKLYLGSDNTLYYPNAAMTIGACRAYFQLNNGIMAGDPASGIRSFVLNFGDDTNGITEAEANSSFFTLHSSFQGWFTLDGRKLNGQPTTKGVYIHNGRKVVMK